MKNKQLVTAIQAALFSMMVGNVSAATLTESDIAALTQETIVNTAVEDIPTELASNFFNKVIDLSVELNTLSPQLAQFLLTQVELSDEQKNTLQQVVDTAVEAAIGDLTEDMLDTISLDGDQLVIGDLQISTEKLQKFAVKLATFDDFSKINLAVAQYLVDNQADLPSLAEKMAALEDIINPPAAEEEAIAQLTDWSTVKLEAEQLIIGETVIPAELIPTFIDKVASLTVADLETISAEVAQFILDNDDSDSPKLTADQVTALQALLPPTTLTPEEAIAQLTATNLDMVKLDEEHHLMIGETQIPAELISSFIEQVASLDDLGLVSPEVAQFILDNDDPDSSKLTADQVTALQALLTPPSLTPEETIAQLTATNLDMVKLDEEQHLMIGETQIPAELISSFIEQVASLDDLGLVSPEVAKFILDNDDPDSPKLTEAQATSLQALLPPPPPSPEEAISQLTSTNLDMVKLDEEHHLMIGEVKIPAELISSFIEQVASLDDLGAVSPEVAKFILDNDDPDSPKLTADQVEILTGIQPPADDLDISSLDAQAVSELSLGIVASLTPEQVAQFQPEALKGLTPEQAMELTVEAISGLTKEMVGYLSLEVIAALTDEQLQALSDDAKAGMIPEQVLALGEKAKEIFDEEQLIALFTTDNGQVTICHVPDGNPGAAHSIDISPTAVGEHLSHGDSVGPCANEGEEEVDIIEIDIAHLTAQQLSEIPPEIIVQLTARQIALIPIGAMIGITKEQIDALTEKAVSGLTLEQVLNMSSEALAGFNASNIGGLNGEILSAIGLDLLKLMSVEELKLLSESNPDVIVLVTLNVLKTTLPPPSEEDSEGDNEDEGNDEGNSDNSDDEDEGSEDNQESVPLPSGLKELLTVIGWEIQSNQLVLSPESVAALSIDFFVSISVEQFHYLHPTIMAQLTTEQITSIKEEILAQLGEEYLDMLPEEKIIECPPQFLTKWVLQLDVKKIEKKFKKKHAKNYAKYLKEFYEKLFKPLGWKVEIKEKHGQFFVKIKPKKEAFKFVSKQFVSLIDFEPDENETSVDLTEKLTLMPTDSLEGLEDEQIELIPEEQVEKLPAAIAKPVKEKQVVIKLVEQASSGNVTEETLKELTPEVIGKIQPEHVAKFSPVTFKLFTSVQISSLPIISIRVMTAPMVAQLTPEAVSGLQAAQISAIPASSVAGFNAMMIANLSVTAVVGFKRPQLAFLPIQAMEGWKPETFAALDPNEVDGFTVYQMIAMLHAKPEIRKAITIAQWENLPITPNTPVIPVVAEETGEATDENGEATDENGEATDENGEATDENGEATDENGEATDENGEATDENGEATDENGEATDENGEATDENGEATDENGEATDENGEATDENGEATDENGEVTPVEVTVDEETGQITLPPAEIDPAEAEAEGIAPTDLEIEAPDLTQPLIIDGEEVPPILEQLEETLADAGMPELTVTQEDGIVNVTGSGDLEGTEFAFVPDEETIVQVEDGTPVGVTQDENGFYVVVTPKGIKMTLSPAPKKPVQLLKLAHGKKGKGKLKKKKHGAFYFPVEGYGNVAVMFDSMIVPAPVGMSPGVFFEGSMGSVVYPDGTMQVMHPAMPNIAQLQVATMAFLGVEITFEYQVNGTAEFELNGQNFKAIPTFDVAEDNTTDTSSPVLEVSDPAEGEQVETLNEQGELVSQEVIAKATLTTEEGTQEINVIEDAINPESNNGETTPDGSIAPEVEDTSETSNTSEPGADESNVPVTEEGSNTGDTTDEGTEPVTDSTPETTSNDATGTNTTDSENGTDTTESGTGEVTNDSTEPAPDTTTPDTNSTIDDSEDSTSTVTEPEVTT
jgi:hypothetical protein